MNTSVKRLYKIASKETKIILGLMSGTSLDGLDLALCQISGSGKQTSLELLKFKTVTYPENISIKLQKTVSVEQVSARELTVINTVLGDYYAKVALESLDEWKMDPLNVDCIASHGQTIYHAPATQHQQEDLPNATLQMGDGDHIAHKTGILTVSDFRQKHTAACGEGAPMVSLVDELLFRHEAENRVLLNIGGIANFTYLPAYGSEAAVLTTDSGPGNTLINKAAQKYFNKPFDKDGKIAKSGTVQPGLLKALTGHSFFAADGSKSTGPEMFNMDWVKSAQQKTSSEKITGEDLIATLTDLTAQTIAESIQKVYQPEETAIYLSGGGIYNQHLVERIEQLIGQRIHSFRKIGFNPDAKEAACFAVLANETLSGEGFELNDQKVNFGKISLPV